LVGMPELKGRLGGCKNRLEDGCVQRGFKGY
jgi:hypothetical protein